MNCLLTKAPSIIMPNINNISIALLKLFRVPNLSLTICIPLLKLLSEFSLLSKQQMMPYLRDFIVFIIEIMHDVSEYKRAEISINTLTDLIKNTGYVILPYYEYPQLLNIILEMIRNQYFFKSICRALYKLIGALGAIDSFLVKKLQLYMANKAKLSSEDAIRQDFKESFSVETPFLQNSNITNLTKLFNFFTELTVISEIDEGRSLKPMKLPDLKMAYAKQLLTCFLYCF